MKLSVSDQGDTLGNIILSFETTFDGNKYRKRFACVDGQGVWQFREHLQPLKLFPVTSVEELESETATGVRFSFAYFIEQVRWANDCFPLNPGLT